ncbi:MAG: type II secretion system F family protein [Candidatus Kariarchaeaceae archaeon]
MSTVSKKNQSFSDQVFWIVSSALFLILIVLGLIDFFVENTIVNGSLENSGEVLIPVLDINDFIIWGIILLLIIPAIAYFKEEKRLSNIDKNLPYLLREIADAQRIGMSLPRAVSEAAKRNYGPLTPELRKLAAKVSWGIPFRDAMISFRESLNTSLANRATVLILEAERSGGDLEQIFSASERHVQDLLDIKNERIGQMKPYLYIVYASFIIFVGVAILLFNSFFIPFSDMGADAADDSMFSGSIPLGTFRILFLHMLVIEGLFAGLVAGKLGSGSAKKSGLLHATIMMLIGWTAFRFAVPTV